MCRIIYDVKNSCLGCLGSSQNKLTFFFVDGWVDLPFLLFSLNRHIFCHNFFYCDSFVVHTNYNCGLLCCQLIYSIVFSLFIQ